MKVLFVSNPNTNPLSGGGASFNKTVTSALERWKPDNHTIYYVHPRLGQNLVASMVEANQIDFVWYLSPYYEPSEAPFAITVWDLAHRETPYFPEVSTTGWTWDQREAFYSYVLPKAAMVVTGNYAGAEQLEYFYRLRRSNIRIIPLPVDVDPDGPVTPLQGVEPEKFLFYPAQFWPHKNHITLVDMLAFLHNKGRKCKLVFTGSDKGNLAHVKSRVRELALDEHVIFAGFVDEPTLRWCYKNAFAMVYASLMGPDNLPPVEAAAYRCQVLDVGYPLTVDRYAPFALDAKLWAERVIASEDQSVSVYKYGNTMYVTPTGDHYVKSIGYALDDFAKTRRLWAFGYRHT